MKKIIAIAFGLVTLSLHAQTYPNPEFSNEVSYLKKDSIHKLVRLEKSSSTQQTNVKAAGFGGMENGYSIQGLRSSVRFPSGSNESFVFFTGSSSSTTSNSVTDSTLRANGMDPAMLRNPMGMTDPAQNISLYKVQPVKNERKIILVKSPGMMSISKKAKSSEKHTFSAKKIREGYWELIIDKPLPKGEYAFVVPATTGMNIDGSVIIFSFGID